MSEDAQWALQPTKPYVSLRHIPFPDPEAVAEAIREITQTRSYDGIEVDFCDGTAFSPTDVPVLSRWAKLLMMIQAMISLLVLALLAGRAVNIL